MRVRSLAHLPAEHVRSRRDQLSALSNSQSTSNWRCEDCCSRGTAATREAIGVCGTPTFAMGDFHHHQFLTSMVGGQPNPNIMAQEVHQAHMPGVVPLPSPPVAAPFSGIGYFTAFHDPLMFSVPKTQRSRRKSTSGLDTVKHRRTRSGCFMCRSRRVKVRNNFGMPSIDFSIHLTIEFL